MPWIRAADRNFKGDDGEAFIESITIEPIEES
jgi:hypothetical protein